MSTLLRTVQSNRLSSDQLPMIQIEVDPSFHYIGGLRFILYEVAHVEQHHFVIADAQRRVQQLLWFQFEGFLDNNQRRYQYGINEVLTLGGCDFLHDADVHDVDQDYQVRPTSDSAHVVDFLRANGYGWSGETCFKRFVWLDPDQRNELMIIYSEDLSSLGYRMADLTKTGSAAAHWIHLFASLHDRALQSFKILAPGT
jgi:hypothetical protein